MERAEPEGGPVAWLIGWSARNAGLVVLLVALLSLLAWRAMRETPLDALPDLSDVQVVIRTEWPGRSPDLVENQVTWPVSSALLGAPQVEAVRGLSDFGVSTVYVIFDEDTDLYWARSRVLEYLSGLQARLPSGVQPALGPDASGVGWVFQYALLDRTGRNDLADLRALQDWNVRYALTSVPGVAEVATVGGYRREVQVDLDPVRMRARGVGVQAVVEAVRGSSDEAGGHVIELAGHEHMIRAKAWVQRPEELAETPVGPGLDGRPVRVGEVAEVHWGAGEQRGLAELDGEGEVVGGIVVMRQGESALAVIDGVKERIAEVRAGLPPGVELVVTYDRSGLIEAAIGTLTQTLFEEMLVVSVVIVVFLLHLRSALVPILTLPVAVLLAFLPMSWMGVGADIMSLGGIAVAIGAMVDGAIILVENVHKGLERWEAEGRVEDRQAVMVRSMQEVGPSLFFSLLLMTVAFLPVFGLTGAEGRLFKPLAWTKTLSMGFASLLAVTLTPAMVVLVVRGRVLPEARHPITRALEWAYIPVLRWVVRLRWLVVGAAACAVVATVPIVFSLSREFMPPLHEGALLYMPTAPPGMAVGAARDALQAMDARLAQVPEVERVFGKMGRADTATDPAPLGMAEVTLLLKPEAEWRPGLDWDGLVAELDAAVQVPGMPNLFWMPIQTRTEMLATGIRSPLGVQVFGPDLDSIEAAAVDVERALASVPGTRSATAERATGGFYLDIDPRREALTRHGLRADDLLAWVRGGLSGAAVGETLRGRERIPLSVRFARDARSDADRIGRLPVQTASGALVPLAELAELRHVAGPPMIRSEAGSLVGYVFVDPGEVPLADYVAAAKARVADTVSLPAGVRLGWTGQYRYYERARDTLMVLLPITLLLVVALLWMNTGSLAETAIVVCAVPFSLVGTFWLLWWLDFPLSVAVWVGIIAMIGLDAETSVVMLLYLTLSWRARREAGTLRDMNDLTEVIIEGAARRMRPKLMTVMTTILGLLPLMVSAGVGADVMRRVAAPMVGGLVTSFLMELVVYPAIFAIWRGRGVGA